MFIALMLSCLLSCFYYSKNRKLLQASREIVPDKSKRAEATEQAETEIQETEATQPLPPVQEDKGPDRAVMILFLIAGVIALLCIGLLVWIFLDYRARQKRKKNRKRKAMEWDT